MIIESTTITQTMQHENLNIDWHRKIMRSGGAMKIIDQGKGKLFDYFIIYQSALKIFRRVNKCKNQNNNLQKTHK
jgi:hypothetical protein